MRRTAERAREPTNEGGEGASSFGTASTMEDPLADGARLGARAGPGLAFDVVDGTARGGVAAGLGMRANRLGGTNEA